MSIRQDVEERAFYYHQNGFHCAEAVAKAVMEHYAKRQSADIPRVATAFGGGIGRTKAETCGALTGGVVALGYLYGRSQPGEDWSAVARMAEELRARFLDTYGASGCSAILDRLGPQENMMKCKRLSGVVAGMIADILESEACPRPEV